MFHLPLKTTERVDLQRSLHRFVEESYSLEQADEHRDAFAEVHTLRERCRTATLTEKGAEDTVRLLARYYRLLTNLRTRFGTAVDDSDGRVGFTWKDAWHPAKAAKEHSKGQILSTSQYDLQFERACVLFNLAAALGYSATVQKRSDADGPRRACQRFQQAAGALALLQRIELSEEGGITDDMGGDALEVWKTIMLAQAQQCFFERAANDKLKPGVVARLAAQVAASSARQTMLHPSSHHATRPHHAAPPHQVAAFYASASTGLTAYASLKGRPQAEKMWPHLLEWNEKAFGAWAQVHAAAEHAEAFEYGAQVSRLSSALDVLEAVA